MKYKYLMDPLVQGMKIITIPIIVLINIGLFLRFDLLFSDIPRYLAYIFIDFLLIVLFNSTIVLKTSDKGMFVNYFFSYYFFLWSDIVELKRVETSGVFLSRDAIWYIHVRNLPFIYRIFGLFIAFRFIPCIILTGGIKDLDKLLNEINSNINKTNKSLIGKFC